MDCCGMTDVGRVRPTNEDQFLVADLNKSMLVHQTSLSQDDHTWLFRLQERQDSDLEDELKAVMEACQRSIETAASARPDQRGMGTTLTMAYVLWPRLYVVHAGDSRCYLFRPPKLEQITTDQTMAQQLVERGVLTPEDAPASRWSHVLWSCLGGQSRQLQAEVYKATLTVGDTLLLCTDGVTGHLGDEELIKLLRQGGSAEETCRRLVAAANQAGGADNITAVVARFLDAQQQAALAHHAVEATASKHNGSNPRQPPESELAAVAK
jgi:protein phosphatase